MFLKMRMLIWLIETETGDLSEANLRGPEKSYYETMLIQAGIRNITTLSVPYQTLKKCRLS